MKHLITAAALALTSTTATADIDGLSMGLNGAMFSTYLDKAHYGYAKTINTHGLAYGGHVRYLVQNEQGWTAGAEFRWQGYPGTTINAGKGKEALKYGFDVSGILGYQSGRIMPHAVVGLSMLQTSKHENDGMHYGVGLTYEISEHVNTTLRVIKREFDGPYQGSDLDMLDVAVYLTWSF